jgi:hypothetical protein
LITRSDDEDPVQHVAAVADAMLAQYEQRFLMSKLDPSERAIDAHR